MAPDTAELITTLFSHQNWFLCIGCVWLSKTESLALIQLYKILQELRKSLAICNQLNFLFHTNIISCCCLRFFSAAFYPPRLSLTSCVSTSSSTTVWVYLHSLTPCFLNPLPVCPLPLVLLFLLHPCSPQVSSSLHPPRSCLHQSSPQVSWTDPTNWQRSHRLYWHELDSKHANNWDWLSSDSPMKNGCYLW